MSANNVRPIVDEARPIPSIRRLMGADPKPGEAREGVLPGQWTPDPLGLPLGCPVTPLGCDGPINYFLDPIGQLAIYAKPYGQADTLDLFRGRHLFLYWMAPKWKVVDKDDGGKEYLVDGWKNEKIRESLIAAATAKGPWSPAERLRGRGGWLGPDGGLVLHLGEEVLVGTAKKGMKPGEIDRYVYPTRPAIPTPSPKDLADAAPNPAARLRELFSSWAWARPDIDPQLLLGWFGVALLGAALPWRSAVFITGDKGSGKSTLQDIVKGVLGDWLIQTTNTTAAGIYQRVGHDSLPVAVDEFEGKADNGKAKALLELARQASSGGLMLRGGDKHTGVEFHARSAFLFSSINAPPMEPQDLSRFALLRLHRLPPGQAAPQFAPRDLESVGRVILRRLVEQWPRYHETLAAFKGALAIAGMDGRGQDTFGTLLACADLIEHDGWSEERLRVPCGDGELRAWADMMKVGLLAEFEDANENWRLALNHLLSVPVEAWRNGVKSTVGQVVEAFMAGEDDWADIGKVRRTLASAGLGLKRGRTDAGMAKVGDEWLIVPNQSPAVRRLFEGTKWAGELGAGVWQGALRQSPRETLHRPGNETIAGVKSRCTLISLQALYGRDGIMKGSEE